LFWNFNSLGRLTAGDGVELAVLSAPAPGKNASYQACKKISSRSYVTQINLDSLGVGATICAFTPNQQVIWLWFLPPDQANGLLVDGIAWTGPTS
jgi:hypothetical protein